METLNQYEAREELNRKHREGEIDDATWHYQRGVFDTLKQYAYWKDGVEYIGTQMKKLDDVFSAVVKP